MKLVRLLGKWFFFLVSLSLAVMLVLGVLVSAHSDPWPVPAMTVVGTGATVYFFILLQREIAD